MSSQLSQHRKVRRHKVIQNFVANLSALILILNYQLFPSLVKALLNPYCCHKRSEFPSLVKVVKGGEFNIFTVACDAAIQIQVSILMKEFYNFKLIFSDCPILRLYRYLGKPLRTIANTASQMQHSMNCSSKDNLEEVKYKCMYRCM